MSIWAEVAKYQTLIVGAVGFAGVMYSIRANAKTASDERRELRDHECQSMRVALTQELQINRDTVASNADSLLKEESTSSDVAVPKNPINDIYKGLVDRIGLLSEDEVGKVLNAYLSLEQFYTDLFLIGTPPTNSDRHLVVKAAQQRYLAQKYLNLLTPIDEALEALMSSPRAPT